MSQIEHDNEILVEEYKPTGVVYELLGLTEEGKPLRYIGSTFGLQGRLAGHRCGYRRWKEGNPKQAYCTSFSVLARPAFGVRVLESHPGIDEAGLRQREQFHLLARECVNKQRAFATDEDRREQSRASAQRSYAKNPETKRSYYARHRERLQADGRSRYYADREGRLAYAARKRAEKRAASNHGGVDNDGRREDGGVGVGEGEGTASA